MDGGGHGPGDDGGGGMVAKDATADDESGVGRGSGECGCQQ